jgi:hypothetical protein
MTLQWAYEEWLRTGDHYNGLDIDDMDVVHPPAKYQRRFVGDIREWSTVLKLSGHLDRMLKPFQVHMRCQIEPDILEVDGMDMTEYNATRFAMRIGYMIDECAFKGDGQDKPLGLFACHPSRLNTTEAALSIDNLLTMVYETRPMVRQNGVFFTHPKQEILLRQMRDGYGQFLWQPDVRAGRPNTFLGYPCYTTLCLEDTIVYGDPQQGFRTIHDARLIATRTEYLYSSEFMGDREKPTSVGLYGQCDMNLEVHPEHFRVLRVV